MVCVDHYGITPFKKVDQDPGCSDCMRRCDSSSFECFPTKKNWNEATSHILHTIYDIFNILHKIW